MSQSDVETTRLVMLMDYVERHQHPPDKGVTLGQLRHAGYSKEEVDIAVDQGYIEKVPGPRLEFMVSGFSHGSI